MREFDQILFVFCDWITSLKKEYVEAEKARKSRSLYANKPKIFLEGEGEKVKLDHTENIEIASKIKKMVSCYLPSVRIIDVKLKIILQDEAPDFHRVPTLEQAKVERHIEGGSGVTKETGRIPETARNATTEVSFWKKKE